MSNTLTYADTIQRTGYTTINGVKVVQYTCIIPSDNPRNIRITMVKMNAELYKANRDICRADYAEFEDAAYQLQDKYIVETDIQEEEIYIPEEIEIPSDIPEEIVEEAEVEIDED